VVKKYYPGETKEQRKARKQLERETGKKVHQPIPKTTVVREPPKEPTPTPKPPLIQPEPKVIPPIADKTDLGDPDRWSKGFEPQAKRYIACLKHGTKYDASYVNTLYNMCKRNMTLPFEFVCFTENQTDLHKDIRIEPLPQHRGLSGWWYKPMFFDKNFPLDGTLLYMDLDIVINANIDKLFTYRPDKFCIIRDFNRSLRSDWNRMNSSIFRLQSCSMGYVYDEFMKDHGNNMRRYHGDQDWIYEQVKSKVDTWSFWPDDWILSYKWEMRDRNDLHKPLNQPRNFRDKKEPKLLPNTCIAVFHGEPHPHQCEDDWVKENWK